MTKPRSAPCATACSGSNMAAASAKATAKRFSRPTMQDWPTPKRAHDARGNPQVARAGPPPGQHAAARAERSRTGDRHGQRCTGHAARDPRERTRRRRARAQRRPAADAGLELRPRFRGLGPGTTLAGHPTGRAVMRGAALIVLAWNQWPQTRRCLDSLLACDLDQAEIIVVDNGSVDATAEGLAAYGNRLRCVRLPENLGFVRGMNAGIAAAR